MYNFYLELEISQESTFFCQFVIDLAIKIDIDLTFEFALYKYSCYC